MGKDGRRNTAPPGQGESLGVSRLCQLLILDFQPPELWENQVLLFKPSVLLGLAQLVKNLPAMRETWVRSLGWEDPPEEDMVTHTSILIWEIPRTEEPGGLQSMGLQRVRHDLVTKQNTVQRTNTVKTNRVPWNTFPAYRTFLFYSVHPVSLISDFTSLLFLFSALKCEHFSPVSIYLLLSVAPHFFFKQLPFLGFPWELSG